MEEEMSRTYDRIHHKEALLDGLTAGQIVFEGRLGNRCDPPPALSHTWREYCWAGHSAEFTLVPAGGWLPPKEGDAGPALEQDVAIDMDREVLRKPVIEWDHSVLRTPHGEFIGVRCLRSDLREWHPGPGGATAAAAPLAKRRRGRKKGDGSYQKADQASVTKMGELIESGAASSVQDAARQVASDAKGAGTPESKIERLRMRYREQGH
jgi:hypothetical protein